MSVYAGEKAEYLGESLRSLLNQTLLPEKIIIVKDGTLTASLEAVISAFKTEVPSIVFPVGYDENKGLGYALNFGMKFIDTDIVARMDADDIAVEERFQIQIEFLRAHPEIDAVGSLIAEFADDATKPHQTKKVPEYHPEILRYARLKNPINHMTVVFRRDIVERAGGYMHAPFFEDYYLWVRMLKMGMKFHNLQTPLILARVGNNMVGKRHGAKYLRHEINHFRSMRKLGFLGPVQFLLAIGLRAPFRLIPKKLLERLYSLILRKKI